MTKRILALMMALLLVFVFVAACDNTDDGGDAETTPTPPATTTPDNSGAGGGGVDVPPPPPVDMPDELAAVGAQFLYVWPAEAGQYDPSLDDQGIIDGTLIFSCYEFDFTTYAVTPGEIPTDIEGYEQVDAPADMTAGTWVLLEIDGAVPYHYVLLMD